MDQWEADLLAGRPDEAWDRFLEQHRRLVLAAIRHYAQDYDDVMDVFARVCDALRENDLRRLRAWVEEPTHRARFSTWLVTVVRHLTVDWFRRRDGRRRLSAAAEALPSLQRRICELVFVERRSHVEAFELLVSLEAPDLTFSRFKAELRATYRAVTAGRRGALLREGGAPVPMDPDDVNRVADPAPVGMPDLHQPLQQALAALTDEDRVAVELYVLEELPASDVARILALPNAKAVYNRVYRALATLRARLERSGVTREDL